MTGITFEQALAEIKGLQSGATIDDVKRIIGSTSVSTRRNPDLDAPDVGEKKIFAAGIEANTTVLYSGWIENESGKFHTGGIAKAMVDQSPDVLTVDVTDGGLLLSEYGDEIRAKIAELEGVPGLSQTRTL